jgi:hypothetical protein
VSHDLYLYALAGPVGEALLGEGLAGEPLRQVQTGPVTAVIGDIQAPAVTPETLAAHDAVVRRLFESLPAILPARFGQAAPNEKTLTDWIASRERELVEALALVEGCVQMTLRVFAGPDALEPEPESALLPEIAPLREALWPILRAERVQRVDYSEEPRPLRATAYDLVAREDVETYLRIIEETAPRLDGWKVAASGPWPPYAFAPGLLA